MPHQKAMTRLNWNFWIRLLDLEPNLKLIRKPDPDPDPDPEFSHFKEKREQFSFLVPPPFQVNYHKSPQHNTQLR